MSYKAAVSLLPMISDGSNDTLMGAIFSYANQKFQTLAWSVDDALNLVNSEDANEDSEILIWNARSRMNYQIKNLIEKAPNHVFMNYPTEETPYFTDLVNSMPRNGNWSLRDIEKVYMLSIHHTVSWNYKATNLANAFAIANYHINNNDWVSAGYHFLVAPDGEIMKLNYLNSKTYHIGSTRAAGDENDVALGIALGGDFRNNPPSEPQVFSAASLVSWLQADLPRDVQVLPHKRSPGAQTVCPGYNIDSWLKRISGVESLV